MKKLAKRLITRLKYAGRKVRIDSGAEVALSNRYGGCNRIGKDSRFFGSLGRGSYVGSDCRISADVGNFCCIASNVVTAVGSHPSRDFVSIHPAFYSPDLSRCGLSFCAEPRYEESKGRITIGNDVWVGTGAILLDGVKIGDGAIVAAGAVVCRDVEPYSVVAGVPAKELRKRFSAEEIQQLLELRWWDKPDDWLREKGKHFSSAEVLLREEE